MQLVLVTPPALEPIDLTSLKSQLRLDVGGNFSDYLTSVQSIAPGSHATTTGYALLGAGVDVLGYQALVTLVSGTNAATGTVDAKIQESDDDVDAHYVDWTGGAFTQVTTANDNATYEKQYTGTKQWIRVVSKVLLAACEFGVSIIKGSPETTEDDLLTACIVAAREYVETFTHRALITQTWDMYLDFWSDSWHGSHNSFGGYGYGGYGLSGYPGYGSWHGSAYSWQNAIRLPFGKLQSVTSMKYKDSTGAETTMTPTTDYLVDANTEPSKVFLPYGCIWPPVVLYPSSPISIRFICGYGSTAASVPQSIRTAIKMIAADFWANREAQILEQSRALYQINPTVEKILWPYRLWT